MQDLFAAALLEFERAYAPYSEFRVGAAVRGASGKVFAGANVENASYPLGSCAEAGAIAALVAAGERRITEALVLAAGDLLCTPCGGCRQRLAEFAAADVPVHLCGPEGLRRTLRLGELLPWWFSLEARKGSHPGPAPEAGDSGLEPGNQAGSEPGNWEKTEPENREKSAAGSGGALEAIRARRPGFVPRVGLILGSGLNAIADALEDAIAIDYGELVGFPRASVEGHAGRLVLGTLAGVPVACLQGRVHLYEGVQPAALAVLPRTLKALGCELLILTNAAGALRAELLPGSVVLIEDHINLLGQNPLVGTNDEAIGPRFPDMTEVYDRGLRARLSAVAARLGIPIASGVYLATLGPCFETPAEIRAFRALGADLVGMSTVPEAISARHCGLNVLGLSIVTNAAAGLGAEPLRHAETLARAAAAATTLQRLLTGLLEELAE
jgi:xanthosine phosphorylase